MKRLTIALLLWAACLQRMALADDAPALVARWDAAWSNIQDYYCGCHTRILKGTFWEDRTYRIWFKKPLKMRTEIAKGNRSFDTGSVAIYTGGDRVVGHQGGLLSAISLSLGLDDSKTTSIRGGRITELQFGWNLEVLHRFLQGQAPTEITTGTVDGHTVTVLTCTSTNRDFAAGNSDVAREVIAYDNTLNVPLTWHRFDINGTEIATVTYYDVRLNTGMADSTFQVHTHVSPP